VEEPELDVSHDMRGQLLCIAAVTTLSEVARVDVPLSASLAASHGVNRICLDHSINFFIVNLDPPDPEQPYHLVPGGVPQPLILDHGPAVPHVTIHQTVHTELHVREPP